MKAAFFVPEWISTRLYRGAEITRSIVTNDRDHEVLTFDGPSAELWDLMVKESDVNGFFDSSLVASKFNAPIDEVNAFIDQLLSASLLSAKKSAAELVQPLVRSKKDLPSQRYAEGGYVEAAPGGTNLQVENEILEFAHENGHLYAATWEITYRCNESCIHCFNPGASHEEGQTPSRKTEELTTEEAKKLLLDLKALGVFRLLITGGEVLLRKDIFELIRYAKKNRFSITIFTNGVLLNDQQIEELANLYLTRVEMSIYSSDPDKHDAITRLKKSYSKTFESAVKLKSHGVSVAMKMISMRNTINDADEFIKICDELDLEGQVDFNMSAGVDGSTFPLQNLIPASYDLIAKSLVKTTALYVGEVSKPRKYDPKKLVGERVCGAGVTLLSISPEGHLYPCNSLPIYLGNTREEGVSKVWQRSSIAKMKSQPEKNVDALSKWQSVRRGGYEVCGTFDRCGWCQKCPGMALLETGSELKPSTINCRNAAARMVAFDLLVEYGDNAHEHIDIDALSKKYPNERALWEEYSQNTKISLDDLRQVLKEKTRAKALQ